MSFGVNLIRLREGRGLSRKDLADNLGIPYTTLRNYETDQREPGHGLLIKIAQMFSVSIDELIGVPHAEKKAPPISDEAFQVGVAYDGASEKDKATVRVVLSLSSDSKPVKEYRFATAAKDGGRRETVLAEENIAAADKAIEDLKNR